MKRKEFLELVREAEKGSVLPLDNPEGEAFKVLNSYLAPFDGIALHKKRVMAKKEQCITFIRHEAMFMNGNWSFNELERLAHYFKRVDLI